MKRRLGKKTVFLTAAALTMTLGLSVGTALVLPIALVISSRRFPSAASSAFGELGSATSVQSST